MMNESQAGLSTLTCIGTADCLGGRSPELPLDKFPLLAWGHGHPVHGSKVFTEDGRSSVEDIALAACEHPDYAALAFRFKTTEAHISQAVEYACKVGFLGR